MSTSEQARIADTLGKTFREIQKLISDFAVEANLYQSTIEIKDEPSRMVFQALTRAAAVSDQMQLSLNIMGEDLRVIESASSDPATLLWREHLRDAFDEHCCFASMGVPKVH